MPNFRNNAKEFAERARAELTSGDDSRLRYAALELRFAMEAITYDRALSVKDDIPPEEYKTWQPRKLMQVLHEIDPHIGLTSSLAYGREDVPGVSPPRDQMKFLGTDTVLTLSDLKKHYDAIGSFLHFPTLKQIEQKKTTQPTVIRERCQDALAVIDKVLSSKIWNVNFGHTVSFQCERCENPMRRRAPRGEDNFDLKCFNCGADYKIQNIDAHTVKCIPETISIECATQDCKELMELWKDEIKEGTNWACKKCNSRHEIVYSIRLKDAV